MSASTVSITANQTTATTRRRTVEKPIPTVENENPDANPTVKSNSQTHSRRSSQPRKSTKPRWVTITSILIKNLSLLLVLLGFVQMVRWVVFNAGKDDTFSSFSGDFNGKFSEVESFVKRTMTAMQVQLDAVDKKSDDRINLVRKEFDEKLVRKGEELGLKLKALDARSDAFEKFIDGFGTKSLLSKEEFAGFFEEFKKSRGIDSGEVSLDEIKDYAREVVVREIGKHAADGLGMVDYALAAGGGRVVRHSESFGGSGSGRWGLNGNKVSVGAEKMLSPSFGEPGQCFALKGQGGFVEVALRQPIVVEAVTLEHVDKSVAYDRSSAPKQCMISGWVRGHGLTEMESDNKKHLLAEFTYDLGKSNSQTYKVVESTASALVDTIRLDFSSNHGNAALTCIYRLRVHGHEPTAVPMLEGQN